VKHPAITLFTDYTGGKMLYTGGLGLIISAALQLGTGPEIVSGLYVVGGVLMIQLEDLTEKVRDQ